jgi:hypothetical protein
MAARSPNDQKVNHMTELIHPAFHAALIAAKDRVRDNSAEGAEWTGRWTSNYLNQAIFEDRWTDIHRDSMGAQYCADFLCILGSFEGGDLRLPDLDLNIEWLPNACCMFDGRTFSHEVLKWSGQKRICLVNYIWESSMNDLGVELPSQAPRLSEIEERLRSTRGMFMLGASAGGNLTPLQQRRAWRQKQREKRVRAAEVTRTLVTRRRRVRRRAAARDMVFRFNVCSR